MANKSRDTANLVSAKTGIAVTLTGDPVVLGVGNTEHVRVTGAGDIYLGGYLQSSTAHNTLQKIKVAPYNWTGGSTAEIASIEMGAQNTGSDDGSIIFKTATNVNTGGTLDEAMRIRYDGNVGIGTDTPTSAKLHVQDGNIRISGSSENNLKIRNDNAGYDVNISQIDNGSLRFRYGTTEHLRIDASGILCVESVSSTTTAAKFGTLDGSSFENLENTILVYGHSASDYTLLRGCNTADGTPIFEGKVSGTRTIEIEANGDVHNASGTFSQISDSQFKENIVDSPSQWEDVKALRVRKFNFTEASGYQTHTQIGYVAQEVEQVSPGLIKTRYLYNEEGEEISGSDYKTVKVSLINVKAVKALQEAMARIEILESRLNSAGIATT